MAQTAKHAGQVRHQTGKLSIGLLGPLTVRRDGLDLDITGPKRRALLTLLALHAGRALGRERIVEALWPGLQSGREESTLRTHISYLRDGIEPDRGRDPVFLVTRGQAYMLEADRVELDLHRFGALVDEGRSHLADQPQQALALFDHALGLWRGRPLQDVEYEEFAQDEIRRLETARAEVVLDRAKALVASGQLGAAVTALEPLVRGDPEWEDPAIWLMRALYGGGRQADAMRVARRHRRHLADRGLEPSPRLVETEEQVLRHDPELMPAGAAVADGAESRVPRGYELRGRVGEGSIGTVYRAFQPLVGREVAVKVIHDGLASPPDFVRRFAEAARVVASVEHPHIVPLHDYWRDTSGAFLVMPWMGGGNLSDRLERPLDPVELARLFDQVADALAYAHSVRVVHRAIKASNVLFDGSGNAYLSDFGLAAWGAEGSRVASEATPGEGPTAASDIYALGVLLGAAATTLGVAGEMGSALDKVVRVATSANPADRFPDVDAFRRALAAAFGQIRAPLPRKVRRNPYKGLDSFGETDAADFYGRVEVVDRLLDAVANQGLVAVVAASGAGKSSVVRAGLLPELRNGAIPGSEEWSLVVMTPGVEPFEAFRVALLGAAITSSEPLPHAAEREFRARFDSALDGPSHRAVLFVDQFEELFTSDVEPGVRDLFLDNLVDLATDPTRRVRTVIALRADFSDRALSHPRFGGVLARSSLMLAPMGPDEIEDAIRLPAARAGVDVEPGLVAEILRDFSAAPASLPLVQYVLAELFERRVEDRLTVQAYRGLGGVHGVLERQAETTYASLSADGRSACRQIFLRTVQLGGPGEETRRRVPLPEFAGLGRREAVDEVIGAFTAARILASDRDPVSRVPTLEVSHETVITRWGRFRVWIDESRDDLSRQRRLATAAETWERSGEDPEFLLTGGPMAEFGELADSQRVGLNDREGRFLDASRAAAARAVSQEEDRLRREHDLEKRSRRRLVIGVGMTLVAAALTVLAGLAWSERQRANALADSEERQNLSRELAAASVVNLDSADPDLGLLLAIEAAELTLAAGQEVLPEVVDALHRAVIRPRPALTLTDAVRDAAGEGLSYSGTGRYLAYLLEGGSAVAVIDPRDGTELWRGDRLETPAFGVDFHPTQDRYLTVHNDGVSEWALGVTDRLRWISHDSVTTAAYSDDGGMIAVGDGAGAVTVYRGSAAGTVLTPGGHQGPVNSVDFDPTGEMLVSAGSDSRVLVWDLESGSVVAEPSLDTDSCVHEASWHPSENEIAVSLCEGEAFALDAATGVVLRPFSQANQTYRAIVYDVSGLAVAGAGSDGIAQIFNRGVGGSPVIHLPGGAPAVDVEFNPTDPADLELAVLDVDGTLQIWRDGASWSEFPTHFTGLSKPYIKATPEGGRYLIGGNGFIPGWAPCDELTPFLAVVDASTDTVVADHATLCTAGRRHLGAISDDGTQVAAADPSGDLFLMDVETGSSLLIPDSSPWSLVVDFSPDGGLLAGVDSDGSIAVWDTESLDRLTILGPASGDDGTDRGLVALEFLPGSSGLVSAGLDGTVRLWDLDDQTSRVLHRFGSPLGSIIVSADGATLVGADSTGEVIAFDTTTGEETLPRPQRVAGATSLALSPDGRYLAGGGPGPVVHLWDLTSGEIVRRMGRSIGTPDVAFVNGGTQIRAASLEGVIRGYVLDPVELLEIARSMLGRQLTESECERYLDRACS